MRLRLPLGRRALFAAATILLLVPTMPARTVAGLLGLGSLGFAARDVEGSVWSARASEAQLGGLPLGDLRVRLDPWPLFVGHARLALEGAGDARGSVTVARHRTGFSASGWRLPTAGRFAPVPVSAITLETMRARFQDGLCDFAEGTVRVELSGDPYGVGLPATLTGPARCDAGVLSFDLAGGGGERLLLAFPAPGQFRATLSLRPGDPALAAKLAAAGFATGPNGVQLTVASSW
jgi:general secretion pathway protein N